MCRYELTICWQSLTEIYLTRVKISQKSFRGGGSFLTHTVHNDSLNVLVGIRDLNDSSQIAVIKACTV